MLLMTKKEMKNKACGDYRPLTPSNQKEFKNLLKLVSQNGRSTCSLSDEAA